MTTPAPHPPTSSFGAPIPKVDDTLPKDEAALASLLAQLAERQDRVAAELSEWRKLAPVPAAAEQNLAVALAFKRDAEEARDALSKALLAKDERVAELEGKLGQAIHRSDGWKEDYMTTLKEVDEWKAATGVQWPTQAHTALTASESARASLESRLKEELLRSNRAESARANLVAERSNWTALYQDGARDRDQAVRERDELRAKLDDIESKAPDGREAEELRKGIERLCECADTMYESHGESAQAVCVDDLQELLDDVDARDSLAYLEHVEAELQAKLTVSESDRSSIESRLKEELLRSNRAEAERDDLRAKLAEAESRIASLSAADQACSEATVDAQDEHEQVVKERDALGADNRLLTETNRVLSGRIEELTASLDRARRDQRDRAEMLAAERTATPPDQVWILMTTAGGEPVIGGLFTTPPKLGDEYPRETCSLHRYERCKDGRVG